MKKFFTNKYPVSVGYTKDEKQVILDIGNAFTIKYMHGSFFEMELVNKQTPPIEHFMLQVDARMLELGFTEVDTV